MLRRITPHSILHNVRVPRRLLRTALATALLGGGLIVAGANSAHAAAANPVLILQTSGGIIRDSSVVNNATPLAVSVGSLLEPGTGSRELRVDLDQGTVYQAGGVTAPEGWTIEWSINHGSTWLNAEPSPASTVTNVRATNASVVAGATDGSSQLYTRSVTSNLPAGTFGASTGGDGWDVFFYDNYVLNIFHHDSTYIGLDCHLRSAAGGLNGGDRCAGYDPVDSTPADGKDSQFEGYQTANRSGGWVNGSTGKMYAFTIQNSSQKVGTLCINLDVAPPVSCGFIELSPEIDQTDFTYLSNAEGIGGRLFGIEMRHKQLLCYDPSTNAKCVGSPIALDPASAFGWSEMGAIHVVGLGSKVFASTTTTLYCFESATLAPCAGSWPRSLSGLGWTWKVMPHVVHMNTSGTVDGICLMQGCLDLTGTVRTGVGGWVNPYSVTGWGTTDQYFGVYGSYVSTAGRAFMAPILGSAQVFCFDFATEAACSGFDTTPFATGQGDSLYALRADPNNPGCVFWNRDYPGQIGLFDAYTGEQTCSGNPVITMQPSQFAPRFVCTTSGGIDRWKTITLASTSGNGVATTQKLTIRKANGEAIEGWTDVPLTFGVAKDLSGLPVSTSGARPTFNVAFTGVSGTITAALFNIVYEGRGPELCVNTVLNNTTVTGAPACPVIQSIVGKLSENVSSASTGTALSRTFTISGDANQCPENIQYATPPGPPRDVTCSRTSSGVSTTFKAPLDNGGADIRWYEISLNAGTTWTKLDATVASGMYSATHSGATTGVTTCYVRAMNLLGGGSSANATLAAAATTPTTTPPTTTVPQTVLRRDAKTYSTAPTDVVVGYGIRVVPKAYAATVPMMSLTPKTCVAVGGFIITVGLGKCNVSIGASPGSPAQMWTSTVSATGNPIGSTATRMKAFMFARSSANLQGDVRQLVKSLPSPIRAVVVVGHTAVFNGPGGFNQILSELRARVMRGALTSAGVKQAVYSVGYGGRNTVSSMLTESEQKQNRRVEIYVIY